MPRIGFFSKKGGSAKSTLALIFFSFMKRSGFNVTIDDKDPQGTLGASIEALGWELDGDPDYTLVDYPSKHDVTADVKKLDLVIVPTGISFPDLHALNQTLDALTAKGIDKSMIRIVPCKIRHGATHEDGLARIKKLKYKTTAPLPLRMEIENFVDRGGKLSPAVRETINQIIIKAVG